MSLSTQLKEMGFESVIVEHAIEAAGSSIEQAMEWILANQDKFQPSSSKESPAASKNDEEVPTAEQTVAGQKAKSIKCDDCGKQFPNEDSLVWHASKTGHSNFSQSEEELKEKTPEEIAEARKLLEERIKENRVKKAEKERQEEQERERARRSHGREIVGLRQKFHDDEIKRQAEERRRDKEEDAIARQRIRDQIAKDRENRKNLLEKKEPAKVVPEKVTPAPAKNYDEARIQIRMTNGQCLTSSFKADEQLAAVRCYVMTNRTDGTIPFQLMTSFPRKVFSDADMTKNLRELDLLPSAVLILSPLKESV